MSPTIVIIPGSFSPSILYAPLKSHLQSHGFETIVETLPSSSRTAPAPAATMEDDAAFFHDIISRLADEGKDVVVLAHSYGGIVANQSSKGLSKTERAAAGLSGGIVRLVFLSAVIPAPGDSTQDTMGASGVALDFVSVEGDYMSLDPVGSAKANFNDVPLEEGIEWAKKASQHSAPSFTGKMTYAGYLHLPVSYIICENDLLLPPAFQHDRVKLIEEKSGNKVQKLYIDGPHSVNATQPGKLAGVIKRAIESN